jgi:hypothetical protein
MGYSWHHRHCDSHNVTDGKKMYLPSEHAQVRPARLGVLRWRRADGERLRGRAALRQQGRVRVGHVPQALLVELA